MVFAPSRTSQATLNKNPMLATFSSTTIIDDKTGRDEHTTIQVANGALRSILEISDRKSETTGSTPLQQYPWLINAYVHKVEFRNEESDAVPPHTAGLNHASDRHCGD
ncbi:hypothetical protein J1614_005742 [Plenodomus biglobosus]|nr:hypothetical protein J1614_005742 [Plenodomus biglobosus]